MVLRYTPPRERYFTPYDFPDLAPVRKMDPCKPCWCGSGKKWKWCHKVREQEQPISEAKLLHDVFNVATDGFCLHRDAPGNCGEKIIRAHTIQRRGGLSAIAEANHVFSVKDGLRNIRNSESVVTPVKVGLKSASTFMGFCDRHDGPLFRPIEHEATRVDVEEAFLLAFRAVAYELFAKDASVRWADVQRLADRGQPFEVQVQVQHTVHWTLMGSKLGLADCKGWKADYDRVLKTGDYADFHYLAVTFDEVLPFAGCGGVMPECGFDAKPLQWLGRRRKKMEHVTYNVTAIGSRTVAVLAWLGRSGDTAEAFVRSFADLAQEEMADALLRFAFEHVENLFLKPSWWLAIPEATRTSLLIRLKNGTISGDRSMTCLVPDDRNLFTAIPAMIEGNLC